MLKDKAAVRDFWQEASCGEIYAQGETIGEQFTSHAETRYALEPYLRTFARFDGSGKDVLEVGVGMGADHVEWARSKPSRLVGVDFTPRAVEWTTKRIAAAGLMSELMVADAEQPTFSAHACIPRTPWTPSPCGRHSRPRTTTGPPPHPGGISRRRAFPPTNGMLAGRGPLG